MEIRSAWLQTNEDDYFIGVIVFSSGWVNNLVRENFNFAKKNTKNGMSTKCLNQHKIQQFWSLDGVFYWK